MNEVLLITLYNGYQQTVKNAVVEAVNLKV